MSLCRTRFYRFSVMIPLALSLGACGVFGGDGPTRTPTVGEREPILGVRADNRVDPSLEGVDVVVPPARANYEWTQPGMNAAKSAGHLALPDQLSRAWSQSIQGSTNKSRLAATPVIANGKLFVVDTAGVVRAFDAGSGAPLWSHEVTTTADATRAIFGGGAAIEGGTVFATNGTGDVEALDAESGASKWKVRPAGPLRGSPTLANGNVYVMTQDNQIYALAQGDGSVRWNEAASLGQASIYGVAAPAAAQATIVAGYSTGELTAYRYENGATLWNDALSRTSIATSVSTLTDIDADPVIDRGRVYAVGKGGRMAAYELISGQRIWELNIGGIATPAVAGEWLFVLTDDAKLFAIARGTGRIRWISQLPPYENMEDEKNPIQWTGPVLAGNRLIVASTDGQLLNVDLQNGAFSRFATLKSGITMAPIVANNMLYVLTDDGALVAMR